MLLHSPVDDQGDDQKGHSDDTGDEYDQILGQPAVPRGGRVLDGEAVRRTRMQICTKTDLAVCQRDTLCLILGRQFEP